VVIALSLAVMLARVAVAEAGFDAHETREDAAIYAVLCSRAERRHTSVRSALLAYSGLHFDAARTRRRWLLDLDATGRQPRAWPRGVRWPRERWLAAIALSVRVIAGEVAVPCEGELEHWGAPWLDRTDVGWTRATCEPGIRNAYWRTR
jgi:hypothetical protein